MDDLTLDTLFKGHDYVTVREIAAHFRVTRLTVIRYAHAAKVPMKRPGQKYLLNREQVRQMFDLHEA